MIAFYQNMIGAHNQKQGDYALEKPHRRTAAILIRAGKRTEYRRSEHVDLFLQIGVILSAQGENLFVIVLDEISHIQDKRKTDDGHQPRQSDGKYLPPFSPR
mgnify:CR=1 FL=1